MALYFASWNMSYHGFHMWVRSWTASYTLHHYTTPLYPQLHLNNLCNPKQSLQRYNTRYTTTTHNTTLQQPIEHYSKLHSTVQHKTTMHSIPLKHIDHTRHPWITLDENKLLTTSFYYTTMHWTTPFNIELTYTLFLTHFSVVTTL